MKKKRRNPNPPLPISALLILFVGWIMVAPWCVGFYVMFIE